MQGVSQDDLDKDQRVEKEIRLPAKNKERWRDAERSNN